MLEAGFVRVLFPAFWTSVLCDITPMPPQVLLVFVFQCENFTTQSTLEVFVGGVNSSVSVEIPLGGK